MNVLKFLILIIALFFLMCDVNALANNITQYPTGTFKKKNNGTYIQYDNNGKKIGTYKVVNRKLRKIK